MRATTAFAGCLMIVLSGCTSGGSADQAHGSSTTTSSTPTPGIGDGWPQCGEVRGRPIGCFPNTTATVPPPSVPPTFLATARACRTSDLEVTLEGSQGAGGTTYTPLAFKNRSSTRCSLRGHPTVSFLDRSGRLIGQAAPTPLLSAEPVTLAPGEVADASIGVGSQSLADCRPVTPATVRVVLPGGGTVSVAVPAKGAFEPGGGDFALCSGQNPSIREFQK